MSKSKKKKGLRLAIFGLIAGVLLGLLILLSKRIILTQLIGVLREEVLDSCDCEFQIDDVELSYLTLHAQGKNPRILENNTTQLHFREIHAYFSLRDIMQRRVLLTDLQLKGGITQGIGPSSSTFKLIDHLSEPPPPERQSEKRWKLKLVQLQVFDSGFVEKLEELKIVAKGVTLLMRRNENDDFDLFPRVENLKLHLYESGDVLSLGRIESKVSLPDDFVLVEEAQLIKDSGILSIHSGVDMRQNDRLGGTAQGEFTSDYFFLSPLLKAKLELNAYLGGTFNHPSVTGAFYLEPGTLGEVNVAEETVFTFDKLSSAFSFQLSESGPELSFHSIEAKKQRNWVKMQNPLALTSDTLRGSFESYAENLSFKGFNFYDSKMTIAVSDSVTYPGVTITGESGRMEYGPLSQDKVKIKLHYHKGTTQVELDHNTEADGSLHFEGQFVEGNLNTSLENSTIKLKNYRPQFSTKKQSVNNGGSIFSLSGTGELSGPLDFNEFSAKANYSIDFDGLDSLETLQGFAILEKGVFSLNAKNDSETLNTQLKLNPDNDVPGSFSLKLKEFPLHEYLPAVDCSKVNASLDYSFQLDRPLTGNGKAIVNNLLFGCQPYQMESVVSKQLPLENGRLVLDGLNLKGPKSRITFQGALGLADSDLNLDFRLALPPLAGFFPTIDDLRGSVDGQVQVRGQVNDPTISGRANLKNLELSVVAAGLTFSNTNGEISLVDGKDLELDYLEGTVNNGAFSLNGKWTQDALEDTRFAFEGKDIVFEPDSTTKIVADISLQTVHDQGENLALTGAINVKQAEVRKTLDVRTVLTLLSQHILPQGDNEVVDATLPSIPLDIEVKAARNIFFLSNVIETELRGDLAITGALDSPIVNGKLETLNGWFGFKNKRFDITSGVISFPPLSDTPVLDLFAETQLFARTGEISYVLLEAHGPLDSPQITLSSDTNLPQQELVEILAGAVSSSISNDRGDILESDTWSQLSESDSNSLTDFFYTLASLDRLQLEARHSIRTGLVEPTVVAEKNLTENLSVIGQTFLSGQAEGARLIARYSLSPFLSLEGNADTEVAEETTAFGADLRITLLSSNKPYVKIHLEGVEHTSDRSFFRKLRLTPQTRIPLTDLSSLAERVRELYIAEGFLSAQAYASCHLGEVYCRELSLQIDEGEPTYVNEIVILGDNLPSDLADKAIPSVGRNTLASRSYKDGVVAALQRALRSEGYLASKVNANYEIDNMRLVPLVINLTLGKPVSFSFEGNTIFSPEDFLGTINLFSRPEPFGNNTIHVLLRNMERLYQEAGYLHVTLKFEKREDKKINRTHYIISIDETDPVTVFDVKVFGSQFLDLLKLKELVREKDAERYQKIFNPSVAIPQELESHVQTLQAIYRRQGFPESLVSYNIVHLPNTSKIEIHYHLREGIPLIADWIQVGGCEEETSQMSQLEIPHSVIDANDFIQRLTRNLHNEGYRNAHLWSSVRSSGKGLTLHCERGPQSYVEKIVIKGNQRVPSETIAAQLSISTGDPWRKQQLDQSKSDLLRLGMFSRVEISEVPSNPSSPGRILSIRVEERALTTLDIGGGINSELGLHFFGEALDREFFLDGRKLTARFDIYYDPQIAEISQGVGTLRYSVPDLFNTGFVYMNDLSFQKLNLSILEYDTERIPFNTSLFKRLSASSSVFGSYTIQQENLTNVSPDVILSPLDEGYLTLGFFEAGFVYDKRDNPINPKGGFQLLGGSKLATEAVGSDANIFSLNGRASITHPVSTSRFSIANNLKVAASFPFGDTTDVPISQRFYLGGRTTIRGFRENSLGPRGVDGGVIGGDFLIQNNFEIRYLTTTDLSLHSFVDAGNVYLQDYDFEPDDLRWSAGGGFRYLSPIGPLGFDLGFPLDEREGEPSMRIHFSIGSMF